MRTVIVALLMFVATAAHADTDATKMATDDCARARAAGKTCVLNMGDDTIIADAPNINDVKIDVIKFTTAHSLIRIRKDFIPEILKTAEDL